MTTQTETQEDVRDATDSGPAPTVLGVLTAGWTWRTDPDDQSLSPESAAEDPDLIDRQLMRAFVWSQILIR